LTPPAPPPEAVVAQDAAAQPPHRRLSPDEHPATLLEGISRNFGPVEALRDVTFSVPTGSLVGVVGPSGSGKTTAIAIMTGNLRPSAGRARTLGEDPRHLRRATRERIGLMPQQFNLYLELSAAENVDFMASLFGMLYPRRHRRVEQVLRLVELWDARGRLASELSGGMQRRLQLACALVHEPTLLFLDEPTAGIDPILRQTVWNELGRQRDEGRTLLVTTQYVEDAERCDLVVLLATGRVLAFAPPEDLRRAALGGDVIEVESNAPVQPDRVADLPGVRAAYPQRDGRLWVVVDEAGTATPELVSALEHDQVTSVREYRPSFEEVFATLVLRDGREEGRGPEANPANGGKPDRSGRAA
jgi:ABC-2 type transport system ATP-binding protein